MYAQARQRTRVLSFALSSRMGLTPKSHRRALMLEIGTLLASALILGSALAYAAARLTFLQLDPLPDIPPGPRLPGGLMLAISATLLVVALVGGLLAHRAAARGDVVEVLRVAE